MSAQDPNPSLVVTAPPRNSRYMRRKARPATDVGAPPRQDDEPNDKKRS